MPRVLQVVPSHRFNPEIGRWLWALDQVRTQTIRDVESLAQETLDWAGSDNDENTIGSLLYHVALVEMSWLFMDILQLDFPETVRRLFPHPMATGGRMTHVPSVPISEHLDRLQRSRATFEQAFDNMSAEDWHRLREPEDANYQVSPAWAVFHLIEHEAGHGAQIRVLKTRAARTLSA